MNLPTMETDFLVIGGGSAGCIAAMHALQAQPDLRVTIFEKSDITYGGSIARGMDALNIVASNAKYMLYRRRRLLQALDDPRLGKLKETDAWRRLREKAEKGL